MAVPLGLLLKDEVEMYCTCMIYHKVLCRHNKTNQYVLKVLLNTD